MVYIERIKLKRFKSFRHADIPLSKGFVCLAGPNGCGKSNLLDSIRFAFGENSLKSLRAKKVSDLIMQGADKAEIYLHLNGEKRYEVKRAIRNDGKTLYKLDGKRMTRTAVLDALRPYKVEIGEHNVIAQGEVERIIELNPKERREIIDKVAGISEFEDKKKESLNELSKVEQKVNDATIVMKEREGFLLELEKEKNDALKHMELSSELRKLKGSLIYHEMQKADNEHSKVTKKYLELKNQEEEVKKRVEEIEKRIRELEEKKFAITRSINEKGEREKTTLVAEIEELKTAINLGVGNKEQKEREIERIKHRIKALEEERGSLEVKALELKGGMDKTGNEVSEIEKQMLQFIDEKDSASKGAESLQKKFYETKMKISKLSSEIGARKDSLNKLELEKSKIETSIELKEKELKRITESMGSKGELRKDELLKNEEELKETQQEIIKEIDSLFEKEKQLNEKIPSLEKKLFELKEKNMGIASKLQSVKEAPESQGVSTVLELRDKGVLKGIYGTVSELCKFSEEFSIAVEAAAGARLNYIIVEDVNTAAKAIESLKQKKAGRCTFLPLNVKASPIREEVKELEKNEGVKGLLVDLVQFNPSYYNPFHYVFGDTLVIDDMKAGKKIGIGKVRMVTLEGDLFESSGAITGGVFKQRVSLQKERNELERLSKEIEEIKNERDGAFGELYSIREFMGKKRREKSEIDVKLKEIEIEFKHMEENARKEKENMEKIISSAELLKKEIEESRKELAVKLKAIESDRKEFEVLEKTYSEISKGLDVEKEEEFKRKMGEFEKQLGEFNLNKSNLQAKFAKASAELDVVKQRALRNSEESESLRKELNGFKRDIGEIEVSIASNSKKHEEKVAKIKGVSEELEKFFDERNAIEKQIEQIAMEKGKCGFNYEKFIKDITRLEVQKGTLETRLADLKAEYESYTDVQPIEGKREEFETKLSEIEQALAALGNVNLKAPEIYEQRVKDIKEIKEKVEKLADERRAIQNMIDEIEGKKAAIFIETFKVINENFKKLFGYIFKGEGSMLLENPQDIFNSGLMVKVSKEGRENKYLESMSGGEKALITLLFIFAIQMYKPAPFYILDEADAALDEENSLKLSQLLKELSKTTQFLVVTHNDAILSSADIALGVTMTKEGSKIVGVEFAKVK
jgi:chromosome segregation protein